jgi:multidrug efflux pump subunit AcrA (membrane-fusion protein)
LEDLLDLQGCVLEKGAVIHDKYTAPFRCRVDRVIEGDKNFEVELIDYSDIYVTFDLPQDHLEHVSLGMSLPFECNEIQYEGTIVYISQYITDGTVRVEMSIDNAELLIYSNVSIPLVTEKYENVVVVPQYAIVKTATGQQYVTIRGDDGEKKLTEIVCGRTINDDVIVESGLTGGEKLLVDASSIKNS